MIYDKQEIQKILLDNKSAIEGYGNYKFGNIICKLGNYNILFSGLKYVHLLKIKLYGSCI